MQSNQVSVGVRRRTIRPLDLLLAAIIALLVILAGYGGYAVVHQSRPAGATTIVVYAYQSLLGGCGGATLGSLLQNFSAENGVAVQLECPGGTLVSTLLAQKNAPVADVVVGLDEVTAPQAEANGLLLPYASPALANINSSLVSEVSPDHALTPYEWGYLAFDYNLTFASQTRGTIARATFESFAANSSWASQLMIEDPTLDITGEEFLLWQIAYASFVAHQDWHAWWQAVDPHVRVAPDWGSAYSSFITPPNNPMVVVSYAADPASAAFYGTPNAFNSSVSWNNGTAYGWKTVYGLGIVSGSRHLSADEAFVNWFLSPEVQQQIPTTEWEYPANSTIGVPGVYDYALDPSAIQPLNGYLPPTTIAASLPGWLDDWQSLANQYG